MRTGSLIYLSDNKKYIVCSKTSYDGDEYYCLVENDSVENVKFCEHDKVNNRMNVIDDEELLENLLPLFSKDCLKTINEVTSDQDN